MNTGFLAALILSGADSGRAQRLIKERAAADKLRDKDAKRQQQLAG